MLDDDDDVPLGDDEEEVLVYVDFEGTAGPNTFCNEKLELDMIGLDLENPIMRVNGKYYEGTYENAVGTYMFFEKDTNPEVDDPVFDKTSTLKYYAKSKKILKMKRVFVKPRLEVLGDSNHPHSVPNMDTIKAAGIPPQYQDQALLLWEEMRNERLEALNEYLEKQRQREEKRQQGIQLDSESDDDNPFAMYKPSAQKSDGTLQKHNLFNEKVESIKNDQHTLTIIDPGPSTSKDSHAWLISNDDSMDDFRKSKSVMEPKNQGYIKILSTRKPRKDKKKLRQKKDEVVEIIATTSEISDGSHDPASNNQGNETNNHESVDNKTINEKIISEEKCAVSVDICTVENAEISMDQVNSRIDNINLSNIQLSMDTDSSQSSQIISQEIEIHDKKEEKQKKREAK